MGVIEWWFGGFIFCGEGVWVAFSHFLLIMLSFTFEGADGDDNEDDEDDDEDDDNDDVVMDLFHFVSCDQLEDTQTDQTDI